MRMRNCTDYGAPVWFAVFPDPIVGGAVMDRLVSGAVKLIVTFGQSYRTEGRLWEAKETVA